MKPRIFDTIIEWVVRMITAFVRTVVSILNGIEYSYRWLFKFETPSTYWGNVLFSIMGLLYLIVVSIGIILIVYKIMKIITQGGKSVGKKIKRK
ncbi:hypothetical protein PT160_07830 [Erysipelothrix rhusiopathiae]|nr:hypothetical protein [Erysipelothrix rhusiopathiae]MDE8269074.1 hypothetical protein [Erysipelothrix rhusiopathiae]MDE8270657.1 hypothetical protein [Erysipelothrix rhusiopathiae]MDE8279082.1 hypothetical protein [Erysipelothrix rhusiopathiae]MDE8319432.1 hypothetical protein [Erysipelothrix rhusiopathiae]